MGLLKNVFGKNEEPINSYDNFWNWFVKHEKKFWKTVKEEGDVQKDFLDKLQPRLWQIKDNIYYLTGMLNENTVELILTAEGSIKEIVFVEELVAAAPDLNGWKFTALKPAWGIQDLIIEMDGYKHTKDNLWFYANEDNEYPDKIDITVVHNYAKVKNQNALTSGILIFLDNYLGELNFTTSVDNVEVVSKKETEAELIPIEKLQDYVLWRQKEFVEKYEGTRYETNKDEHSVLEGTLQSGNKLIAVVNTGLLEWDSKASHPWLLTIDIPYDGSQHKGLPDKPTYQLLEEIEETLNPELKDFDGYLWIARQSSNNLRKIYYACKDFRKPSKLVHELQKKYAGKTEITYSISEDKYWTAVSMFRREK